MTKLLIVEDEAIVAQDIEQRVGLMGYEVTGVAASAEEALAEASRLCPDVAIMDIRIRGQRDGVETAALLRQRFNLPVVFLTAYSDDETLARARLVEPAAYLSKPFNDGELRAAIEIGVYRHQIGTHQRHMVQQAESSLAAAQRQATEDRLASLGAMATGLAHEINNPLAYVLSNAVFVTSEFEHLAAALARGELLSDVERQNLVACLAELSQALSDIKIGSERIRDVVADVRTFRLGDLGQRRLTDVHACVDQAVLAIAPRLEGKVRLVRDYGAPPKVEADAGRLTQVFANLLTNAAQAVADGAGPQNEIAIVTRSEAGDALVQVRDTGCGIPADAIDRIFDPFFTTRPVGQGSGLGLSVCRGIVVGLGGRISVESAPGRGSTFSVRLPVAGRRV
jgi:signal transduction histidine kinase